MNTYTIIDKAYSDRVSQKITFSPNKSLGQNFLQSKSIAESIVSLLPNNEYTHTLEIGPGRGALTSLLTQVVDSLYLIERDPYWASIHNIEHTTVCADALSLDYSKLHPTYGKLWQCISNLPYNIASPLMWEIIAKAQCPCVFMVQKEVGERIIAKEHTKAYGVLSVWLQSYAHIKKAFLVPPSAFFPAPKVYSMVLTFTPHNEEVIKNIPLHLADFLHIAFAHRRKQLLPNLKKRFSHAINIFDALQIPYTVRTEELPIELLHSLAQKLYTPLA